MIDLNLVLVILLVHHVADFWLQSHWMAVSKSKSLFALSLHVATYTLVFLLTAGPAMVWWVLLNGALHFLTDFFTSKATSKLWAAEEWHWFFVVVGVDQLIHTYTLLLTWRWLYG